MKKQVKIPSTVSRPFICPVGGGGGGGGGDTRSRSRCRPQRPQQTDPNRVGIPYA